MSILVKEYISPFFRAIYVAVILFGRLPGLFFDRVQLFAQLFIVFNLVLEFIGRVLVLVEKINYRRFDLINYPAADLTVPQLVFRLALEDRVLQLYRYGPRYALPHIHAGVILLVKLIGPLQETFPERAEMGASIACILTIYK